MELKEAIALKEEFVNILKVNGEPAWFTAGYNASTGNFWKCIPDNSGIYELTEELILHPSTKADGVPGIMQWKFKAIREGEGSIMFELNSPSSDKKEQHIVRLEVNN